MDIQIKKLPASRLELAIVVSLEELEMFRNNVLVLFSKEFKAEGFRQGKAPLHMVESSIDKSKLFQEIVRFAIEAGYKQALEKEKIDPLGEPEVLVKEAVQGKPLSFVISVSVFPEIMLPDYKEIAQKVEKKVVRVDEKELTQALEWLRQAKKTEDGIVPELTDEFAKSAGAFENIVALKKSIEDGIVMEKELQEVSRVRQEMLERIASLAKFDAPEVLIQREQDALLAETKKGVMETMQLEFSAYLEKIKKTEEEVKKALAPQAEKRIREFMVLFEIAKKENIMPQQKEVEAYMQRYLSQFPSESDAKKKVDLDQLRRYSEGVIQNEMAFKFLESLRKQV